MRPRWPALLQRLVAGALLGAPGCTCGADEGVTTEAVVEATPEEAPARPPGRRKAPSKFTMVASCPAELAGIESVDRVIPRGCGPIRVKPGYRLDGGSLTIEAGASLEFEAGADLALGLTKPTSVAILGDADAPVMMRAAEGPRPGAWPGLRLHRGAAGATIRNLQIEHAGDPDLGALYVETTGVTIEGMRMREVAGLGVYVNSKGGLQRFADNRLEGIAAPTAMFLPAASMRALQGDNVFPEGSQIRVLGDHLRGQHRWADPGVPVVIGGRIEIAGSAEEAAVVTFAPGLELHFDRDGYINVGYYDPGVLVAAGTAERPILFTDHNNPKPGAWRGINLYKHASASFAHAVFEHGARYVDRGVLYANSEAEVGLRAVTFRENRAGIVLYRDAIRLREFTEVRFEETPRPLTLGPAVFGELGQANEFGGERIVLQEGTVERDATWRDPGAEVEVTGPVMVDGATLSITAGVHFVVRDGFSLDVGARGLAVLRIVGGPERPVLFEGVHDKRGTWDSIHLYGGGEHVLRDVVLRNAGGDAAIVAHGDARAVVERVRCERCFSPTLTWECAATVSRSEIGAEEGTPRAVLEPRCPGS
ncbi:MAG: hypothetical protein H6711_18020 [Myxococcales bacterium]|nr:hypothetical protein [Myxococcales bacterium]